MLSLLEFEYFKWEYGFGLRFKKVNLFIDFEINFIFKYLVNKVEKFIK